MKRLPPYLPNGGDLRRWAMELSAFLQVEAKNDMVKPQAVLLAHQTGDLTQYSASVNGLLMFDPVNKQVLVSVDGAWQPLAFL